MAQNSTLLDHQIPPSLELSLAPLPFISYTLSRQTRGIPCDPPTNHTLELEATPPIHVLRICTSPRSKMFKKEARGGKRELVLRKDVVSEAVAGAVEDGDDLYAVTSLNYLELRGFSGVAQLSGLGSLSGLLQLCLIEDRLERLPDQLGSLSKLRLLDVSRNGLTSLPQSLFLLPSLQTLIVSSNSLTDESFPLIDTGDVVLTNLHHLDMTGNNLTILPSFLSHTSQLGELRISHNSLSSLDPAIIQSHSQSLRVLEAHNNQLTTLPHQLAACSKLKTLLLTDNPLMDRRLLKLVAQHGTTKPKTVLDYLASHATQSPVKKEGRTKKKGKKKVAVKEEESEEDSDVEFSLQLPKVTILRPDPGTEVVVVATGNARRIRPYIVCSIMRGVVLSEEERMKEFIGLQSRLHDTVCKRRRVATIATHDLARLTPPITFLVAPATDITMRPLGWSQEVKVQEFLCHVESNKPGSGGRKAKGVDTVAASLYK